jgi:hypothetical protein
MHPTIGRTDFWPSLYKDAPGFIGPGNGFRERFAKAQAEAEAVMESWRKGDWFYCGIVLSVSLESVNAGRPRCEPLGRGSQLSGIR